MKVDVSKVVAQDKSPSVAGWTLSDMDFEGSEVTLDGWARSIEERDRILAAFYKKGRSTIELGGDYLGWQIRGMGVNHTTDCDLTTDIPSEAAQFSLLFLSDTPYREKNAEESKIKIRFLNRVAGTLTTAIREILSTIQAWKSGYLLRKWIGTQAQPQRVQIMNGVQLDGLRNCGRL